MKSKNSLFLCVILFASLKMFHAKPVMKRILLKELLQQHINPYPSRNTLYVRQRSRNCIDLGPRNTFCLFNQDGRQYGYPESVQNFQEINKPRAIFIDLTRSEDVARTNSDDENSFSEDYLDVNDLSFSRKVDKDYKFIAPNNKHKNVIKIIITNTETKHKSISPRKQKYRKVFNVNDQGNRYILRSRNSDSSDEESEEKSSEEDVKAKREHKKPKRFEIVENSEEESKLSQEETSDESDAPAGSASRTRVIYAQSPTRHLSVLNRRRLPHFLPKRYHWSLDDIQHLPYLWFNGPQGEYAGVFRITS